MKKILQALAGKIWVHSHEEDIDETLVYRREFYSFGPSRGRDRLEFSGEYSFKETAPRFDDRPGESRGEWKFLSETELLLEYKETRECMTVIITELSDEKFVLKKSAIFKP